MKMNPPKKVTVIIAAALLVLGIVLVCVGKAVGAFVCAALAAALMIASVFLTGL